MNFSTFCDIDEIVKRYTEAYMLYNRSPDLAVSLEACVTEEDKEWILSELDCKLPLGLLFSHTYENGKLQITFKEV